MVFLDINTFHGPKAGGIRTYHQAKLDWFGGQSEHAYCLIHPGSGYRVERPSPSVYSIQVYGRALTRDPSGYRLILDYFRVYAWIRKLRPQVIEAGDAWLTSWFCLFLQATGLWRGLLISFYHSDPIPSYVRPWAGRSWLRRPIAGIAAFLFYAVQRRFNVTAVASRAMEDSLRRHGVSRTLRLPFGVPPVFFDPPAPPEPLRRMGKSGAPLRLLYAGRLDRDKGLELLLEILPVLIDDPSFRITVAGRGALADRFEAVKHDRFRFAGFVPGIDAMAALYGSHDVLLAPGPHETFGLVVLEAMAAGLIAVGPDAGGTGELLAETDSPFRFRTNDAEDFLEKIRAAAAADLPTLSARHREVALRYGSWDEAVARMVSAWKERA